MRKENICLKSSGFFLIGLGVFNRFVNLTVKTWRKYFLTSGLEHSGIVEGVPGVGMDDF